MTSSNEYRIQTIMHTNKVIMKRAMITIQEQQTFNNNNNNNKSSKIHHTEMAVVLLSLPETCTWT